jgi:hypothetical protein
MNRIPIWVLLACASTTCFASDDIPPPRPRVDVAALVKQLGSEDFAAREEASRRLSTLSVDAPPPELLEALKSENPEIRDRALRALAALREHILRERELAATAHLPREERFAKRGQVDLFVASTASNKLKTDDDRLWLPAFELGVRTAATTETKAGVFPLRASPGPGWAKIKDFPTYRKSHLNNNLIRTSDPFVMDSKGYMFCIGGIMASGVDVDKKLKGLIVSRGTVRLRKGLESSLVLATGDVNVEVMLYSTIICDGDVQLAASVRSLIVARGNVVIENHSEENTIIAGGKVTLKKPRLDGNRLTRKVDHEDHVQSGVTRPLGYITFFELSTAGVEVKVADTAVSVAKVAEGKSFAAAGVKVGDVVVTVNGKKPDSAESLRRLLRDALALGDATVTLKRGGKTETVKVNLPE